MIARFSDLTESVIVQKNSSLKDFLKKNHPSLLKKKKDLSYLFCILNGNLHYSKNLADGNLGSWFITEEIDRNYSEASSPTLYVSCSQTKESIVGEKVRNYIFRFWFLPTYVSESVSLDLSFTFGDWIPVKDAEKCRISSDFVRKVMHLTPKRGGKSFLERLSERNWDWTKDCLKEI